MPVQNSIPESGSGFGPTGSLGATVNDAVGSAKESAIQLGGQIRQQVFSRADEQRETVAGGLSHLAEAVRKMGEGLKQQEQSPVTQFASHYGESLAGQVERAATYLRQRDTGAMVGDLESLARRQPAVFLGGAFLLGLLASRFLQSSSPSPELMYGMPDPKRALPEPQAPVRAQSSLPSSLPPTFPPSKLPFQSGLSTESGVGFQTGSTLQTGPETPGGAGRF